MPKLQKPDLLAKAYDATRKKIQSREIPTAFIYAGQFLYRSIDPTSKYSYLPEPTPPRDYIPKPTASKLLTSADGDLDLGFRFSGPSGPSNVGRIPHAGGFYCVQQQQALVNEFTHYSGKNALWALSGRCVLKIKVLRSMLVADLSPHNCDAERFIRELGKDMWNRMNDPVDCSVARGIGLAVAESGLRGLSVQTVRQSERSRDEMGDNLVLFVRAGSPIQEITVEEAWYYPRRTHKVAKYRVAFGAE